MIITKNQYITLKNAALETAKNPAVIEALCEQIEKAEKARSQKTALYIMEKRKDNKYYCR